MQLTLGGADCAILSVHRALGLWRANVGFIANDRLEP